MSGFNDFMSRHVSVVDETAKPASILQKGEWSRKIFSFLLFVALCLVAGLLYFSEIRADTERSVRHFLSDRGLLEVFSYGRADKTLTGALTLTDVVINDAALLPFGHRIGRLDMVSYRPGQDLPETIRLRFKGLSVDLLDLLRQSFAEKSVDLDSLLQTYSFGDDWSKEPFLALLFGGYEALNLQGDITITALPSASDFTLRGTARFPRFGRLRFSATLDGIEAENRRRLAEKLRQLPSLLQDKEALTAWQADVLPFMADSFFLTAFSGNWEDEGAVPLFTSMGGYTRYHLSPEAAPLSWEGVFISKLMDQGMEEAGASSLVGALSAYRKAPRRLSFAATFSSPMPLSIIRLSDGDGLASFFAATQMRFSQAASLWGIGEP